MTMLLGGNVRVGFEDNIYYRHGELAKSNAQLVERIVGVARDAGIEIASPVEARESLNIPQLHAKAASAN
jgi:3-keto-5-aminohexanoate cleavage enzyme